VIGQGELAKSAGLESNSCEQLLSPNYIDHRQLFRTLSRQCASGDPRKSQYILGRESIKYTGIKLKTSN
jgi:hypothetical protein